MRCGEICYLLCAIRLIPVKVLASSFIVLYFLIFFKVLVKNNKKKKTLLKKLKSDRVIIAEAEALRCVVRMDK